MGLGTGSWRVLEGPGWFWGVLEALWTVRSVYDDSLEAAGFRRAGGVKGVAAVV